MPNHKDTAAQTPLLARKDLQQAYESYNQQHVFKNNPLLSLTLVQAQAQARYTNPPRAALYLALDDLLARVLIELLEEHHTKHNIPLPPLDKPIAMAEVEAHIKQVIQHANDLLAGLTFIYYYYLRYDLELTVEKYVQLFETYPKQLQRWRSKAWDELRQRFIRLEMETRAELDAHHAHLILPNYHYIPLTSHQHILNKVVSLLQVEQATPLLICGPPGSGKSTIAVECGRHLIDQQAVQNTVYLDLRDQMALPSPSELARLVCLALELRYEDASLPPPTLATHLAIQRQYGKRTLLLLDNAEGWEDAILEAWGWLGHFALITTTPNHASDWRGHFLKMKPLPWPEALELMRTIDTNAPNEKLYKRIWETVGGAPGNLRRALYFIESIPVEDSLTQTTFRNQIIQVWRTLSGPARAVWVVIDLLIERPGEEVIYMEIVVVATQLAALDETAVNEALTRLVEAHLVAVKRLNSDHYLYHIEPQVANIILEDPTYCRWLNYLRNRLTVPLALRYLERVDVADVGSDELRHLLDLASQHTKLSGQWQRWLNVLDRLQQKVTGRASLLLDLEKAAALRWTGRLSEANQLIGDVIQRCLHVDEPRLRAEAHIEQSRLRFYMGDTEAAFESAEAAHHLLNQFLDATPLDPLWDQCIVAMAQGLSKKAPQTALDWITTVREPDVTAWDLIARLELALDNLQEGLEAARQAVQLSEAYPQHPAYPRAVGLLARALTQSGQYEEAIQQFNWAINRMLDGHDTLGLARMYTNYGIACAEYAGRVPTDDDHQGDYLELAMDSLRRALALYKHLQDESGAKAARRALIFAEQLDARRQSSEL